MNRFRSLAATFVAALLLCLAPPIQRETAWAAEPVVSARVAPRPAPAPAFTFACGTLLPCPSRGAPAPANRDVHPFEGTLGRPCGYRWRATPEGTRKVRVCF